MPGEQLIAEAMSLKGIIRNKVEWTDNRIRTDKELRQEIVLKLYPFTDFMKNNIRIMKKVSVLSKKLLQNMHNQKG